MYILYFKSTAYRLYIFYFEVEFQWWMNVQFTWIFKKSFFVFESFCFYNVHLNKHGIICITNILCISILSCGHIIFSKGKPTTNCCLEYKREFWVKLGMYLSCRNLLIMTQIILKQHNILYLYLYMNWCMYIIVGIKFKKGEYENEIQWWNC